MHQKLEYRPEIDGLRAVSVLGVIAYHYGATWLPGGFTGVDVFFVISGFLITSIMFKEMVAKEFSILGFYERRVRRIIPALLVAILATMAAGYFLLMPGDYASTAESGAYSAAGLGNLYFYWNTGYFDRQSDMLPLLHMWSLGVEEQFYIFWPMILWGMVWATKGKARFVIPLIMAGMTVSFIVSVYTVGNEPKAAFYLPHARAWELGLGALLVFVPKAPARMGAVFQSLQVVGIGLILVSFLFVTNKMPFPGGNALYACFGAALVLWPRSHPTLVSSFLGGRSLTIIGRLSYSLYLWHWPVLVFFRYYANGRMPGPAETVVLVLLSFALAYVSWRFVERPFRMARFSHVKTVAIGATALAGVAIVGVGITMASGFLFRVSPEINGLRSLSVMWEWQCPGTTQTDIEDGDFCVFGTPWESAKRHVVLWGDSHAEHFAPILQSLIRDSDISVLLVRSCPPMIDGKTLSRNFPDDPTYSQRCGTNRDHIAHFLDENPKVDLVILASAWGAYLSDLNTPENASPTRDQAAALTGESLDRLAERIASPGRKIAILGDVPQRPTDPVACAIAKYTALLRMACTPDQLATPLKYFKAVHQAVYEAISSIAKRDSFVNVYLPGNGLCKGDYCLSVINGEPLYRDNTHIRRNLKPETYREFSKIIGIDNIFENSRIADESDPR